jgi:hypothetical protein
VNDKPRIIVGLGLGLVALTFPLWYTLAAGPGDLSPKLDLPSDTSLKCVEDPQFMKAHHMELLDQWRQDVVREGKHTYTSKAYGTTCEMSLTKTCLACHTNQETFCNRCHTQAGVSPTCWSCHFEGKVK